MHIPFIGMMRLIFITHFKESHNSFLGNISYIYHLMMNIFSCAARKVAVCGGLHGCVNLLLRPPKLFDQKLKVKALRDGSKSV